MKRLLCSLICLIFVSPVFAQKSEVAELNELKLAGSHVSENSRSGTETHFLIDPLPKRKGSFIGLLIEIQWFGFLGNSLKTHQAQLYLIEPSFDSDALYNLYPFKNMENGRIALGRIDPQMELAIMKDNGAATPHFSLSPLNTDGESYFSPKVSFEGGKSNFRWLQKHSSKFYLTRNTNSFLTSSELDQVGRVRVNTNLEGDLSGQLTFQLSNYKAFRIFKSVIEDGVKWERNVGSAFFVSYKAEPHILFKAEGSDWETFEAEVDLDETPPEYSLSSKR